MIFRLKNMLKNLDRIEDFFIGMTLLFVTLLLFVNVFARYSFGYSIKWAEELTRYLIIWLTFVGGSVCVRKGKHVGVDVILIICPVGTRKVIQFIIALIGFLFSIILFIYGWKITHNIMLSGQLSTAMMIPMYLIYISIPIGGFLMCIRYFQIVLSYLKDIVGKVREEQQC